MSLVFQEKGEETKDAVAILGDLGKELEHLLGFQDGRDSKPFWIIVCSSDDVTGMVFPKQWVQRLCTREQGTRSKFARILVSCVTRDDLAYGSYVLSADRLRFVLDRFQMEETPSAA